MKLPNVFTGDEWINYYKDNLIVLRHLYPTSQQLQVKMYLCTHKHVPIYKVGQYYFMLSVKKGYKNLSSLKRLIK